MCTLHQIDTEKAEAFAGDLLNIMNSSSLALMTSIGHRTGLFDTLSEMKPATSKEIAEAAKLNERYVREWLGAMTTGKIINCEPNGGNPHYYLPVEHAAFLTRAAGADNIGVFAQYFSVLGANEDEIIACFKNGGGVPYSKFKRFSEVMAEDSGQSVVSSLFDTILPLIPGIHEKLEQGIDVLDLGCGMGRALNMLAKRYPNSRFTGYDLLEDAIAGAKGGAVENASNNIHFEVRDLSNFDEWATESSFDLVTSFDAIHDQARPDRVLAGINKTLRDDGTYLMQDIAASSHVYNNMEHPIGTFLYTISTMHCMTVSLAQGGMGMGTMWGKEKALEMLKETGFNKIQVKELEHDFQNYYYIVRKN